MRGVIFCFGLALIVFAVFGIPDLAGSSYEWWMGALPGFLGGSISTAAITAGSS